MDQETLAGFLGRPVSELLAMPPFSGWHATRSIDADLLPAEVWYEFEGRRVQLICDEAELIRTIFLRRDGAAQLTELPFSMGRRAVLERLGRPSKSGPPLQHPVLGEYGSWDRFALPGGGAFHVEYRVEHDDIDRITLMRADAVP